MQIVALSQLSKIEELQQPKKPNMSKTASQDPVARIRRFNRAVTRETGALDQSFLGRGRPLGPARVLHAIGPEGRDLEAIRAYLDLDKPLLSRFLKQLQDEGLVSLDRDPNDGRRRIAVLTEAGQAEFAAYNQLSDDRASRLLDRHPRPEALLEAMDLVASALGRDRIELVECDPRSADAVTCLEAYYKELGERFETGFDVNLSADPEANDMMAPRGVFLVAYSDGMPLGCVGVKGTDKGYAEIKRLWISPRRPWPWAVAHPDGGGGDPCQNAGYFALAARHQLGAARGGGALPALRLDRDRPFQR